MAERQEVTGRRQAARPVGRADGRNARRRVAGGVHDDEGDVAGAQLAAMVGGQVRELQHDRDRLPAEDSGDELVPDHVVIADRGEDHREPVLPRDALDTADDLDGPLARQVLDDELHGLAAFRIHPPARVAGVVEKVFDTSAGRGDTPGRPFSTLDTVESDTDASRAIACSVGREGAAMLPLSRHSRGGRRGAGPVPPYRCASVPLCLRTAVQQ